MSEVAPGEMISTWTMRQVGFLKTGVQDGMRDQTEREPVHLPGSAPARRSDPKKNAVPTARWPKLSRSESSRRTLAVSCCYRKKGDCGTFEGLITDCLRNDATVLDAHLFAQRFYNPKQRG